MKKKVLPAKGPSCPVQLSNLMGVTVQVWVQWPLHSPDLVRLRVSITHFSSPFSYNIEMSGQDQFNDFTCTCK